MIWLMFFDCISMFKFFVFNYYASSCLPELLYKRELLVARKYKLAAKVSDSHASFVIIIDNIKVIKLSYNLRNYIL